MRRRRAREFALRILYQIEMRGEPPETILPSFWNSYPRVNPDLREFAETLVLTVCRNLPEIDAAISSAALNWEISRMSVVDRNILRIGTCEIRHLPEIPPVVAINEAIEIAKVYGTEDSPRFVNGILNRIKEDALQPADEAPPPAADGQAT